jgi:hypothetical protein
MCFGEDKKALSECGKIDHCETCFFGEGYTFCTKKFFMSEKDYNVLMELAERLLAQEFTKEEAL